MTENAECLQHTGAVLSSTTVADFNEDSSVKFKGSEYKYEYMGYSMATGDFNNDNNDGECVCVARRKRQVLVGCFLSDFSLQ